MHVWVITRVHSCSKAMLLVTFIRYPAKLCVQSIWESAELIDKISYALFRRRCVFVRDATILEVLGYRAWTTLFGEREGVVQAL